MQSALGMENVMSVQCNFSRAENFLAAIKTLLVQTVRLLARVMVGMFMEVSTLLIDAVALTCIRVQRQVWVDPGVGETFNHFIAGRHARLTIVDLGEIEGGWAVFDSWRRYLSTDSVHVGVVHPAMICAQMTIIGAV